MSDRHAQWVNETLRHGIGCSVVESHRSLGRHGRFEDGCRKTFLKLTPSHLELGPGGSILSVQLKELRKVEIHEGQPSSPIFLSADKHVFDHLVTLRWNHTGRQAHTKQYLHVVFPTLTETHIFCEAMGDVQRYGVNAIISGHCSQKEPSVWQVARARERFKEELKKWRGKGLSGSEKNLPDDVPCASEVEACDADFDCFQLGEDEDMHIHWAVSLYAFNGRNPFELPHDTLAALVHSGMPLKHRHSLWSHWLLEFKVDELEEPSGLPVKVAHQIDIDIPRTHSKLISAARQKVLERVLKAYAIRNPVIGYCQGMSFIVAIFIFLGFDDETVFAGLCFLVERICPDYHASGLSGYIRDTAVLSTLVHLHLPQAHVQLETLGVPLSNIALDHFITLASKAWPFQAVVKLWDLIFLERSSAVFASFLALLELDCVSVASASDSDPAEFMQRFKMASLHRVTHDLQTVMVCTRRWISIIDCRLIEKLRSDILTDDVSSTV